MESACCSSVLEDHYVCTTRRLHMHILFIMHVLSITILFGAVKDDVYWETLLFLFGENWEFYLDQFCVPVN